VNDRILKDNRITIKEIAELAKVSPATVSLIINEKPGIARSTRDRVSKIIQQLNYSPNLVARSLVKRHSKSIAMLITNTRDPIFPEIAEGIDAALKQYSYSLNIITNYDDRQLESREIQMMRARGIDGIITAAASLDSENIIKLAISGFPIIAVNRRIYSCEDLDFVVADNLKGGYLAIEHLLRLGHERIGIIKGHLNTSTAVERLEGAMKAFEAYRVPWPHDLIANGDYSRKSGYLAAKRLLSADRKPSAIFASNDEMALGALEAIYELSLKIPENIALVGFNNEQITALRMIEMTTVSQQNYQMGYRAAKRLVVKIEGKRGYKKPYHILLEPELVVRKSCGYSASGYRRDRVSDDQPSKATQGIALAANP
jgi:LacI family transcriptional regulator